MTDRTAVVMGGAQGIGLAVARRLAAEGAHVAIVDLNGGLAEQEAAALPDDRGRGWKCDVTDYDQVRQTVEEISSTMPPCRSLIYSVGWSTNKPFLETSLDEQQQMIDINYVGALFACRELVPHLAETGSGRVVLISSDAGRVGTPKEAVYAGAKAALLGFAKSLAIEVARSNITVNVVSPGTTDTTLLRDMLTEEQIAKRIAANPMRRIGVPEDVATAVVFFDDPGSAFITGQVLSINGGMSRLG